MQHVAVMVHVESPAKVMVWGMSTKPSNTAEVVLLSSSSPFNSDLGVLSLQAFDVTLALAAISLT